MQTTHRHVVEQVRSICGVVDVRPGDRITSFLPAAHIADRVTTLYFGMLRGVQVTYVADAEGDRRRARGHPPDDLVRGAAGLGEAQGGAGGQARRRGGPGPAGRLQRAVEVGQQVARAELAGTAVPDDLAAEHATAEATVLSRLRAAVGLDQVRWAWTGAATIAPETLVFFRGLGIALCELWGMSEVTGGGLLNPPDRPRVGTVGTPMPGLEARLADDGELLVRAPFLTSGYRNDPERTAEAIDGDGWLHTGDVAGIDDDGYVTIVDRKKEIIISAGGKNMSPANIESTLKVSCPLAAAITVVGDGRPYNVALVTLDPDAAAAYASRNGLSGEPAVLAQDTGLRAAVAAGIEEGNARLSRVEQVKAFEVLPTYWEPGGDELTPTLKLRRRPIAAKYADVIDRLYG